MSNRDEFDEEDLDDQSHGSVDDDGDEDENDVGNDFQPSTNTPSSPGIPTPVPKDVICGRGKMTSSHPGNRKLRDLVLQKKQEYQRAKRRDEKTSITSEIVHVLRGSGRYEVDPVEICCLLGTLFLMLNLLCTANFYCLIAPRGYGMMLVTNMPKKKVRPVHFVAGSL
jgi:hypothetical protein